MSKEQKIVTYLFDEEKRNKIKALPLMKWSLKSLESFDKELQLRWYMHELGRFTGVDPIAGKFPHANPYNYAENSPIGNVDLWGLQAENFMSRFK